MSWTAPPTLYGQNPNERPGEGDTALTVAQRITALQNEIAQTYTARNLPVPQNLLNYLWSLQNTTGL